MDNVEVICRCVSKHISVIASSEKRHCCGQSFVLTMLHALLDIG